ncbi:hypothetical protein ACFL26_00780 [Patescibacteria group bacterium]
MIANAQREAIEALYDGLRPFDFGRARSFVTPDGRQLGVAGISCSNRVGQPRSGPVLVLVEGNGSDVADANLVVGCERAVLLRSATSEERADGINSGTAQEVVEGIIPECCREDGSCLVFRSGKSRRYPVLVTRPLTG